MTTWWHWVGFNLLVLVLLAFDLGVLHRKHSEIGVKESLWAQLRLPRAGPVLFRRHLPLRRPSGGV